MMMVLHALPVCVSACQLGGTAESGGEYCDGHLPLLVLLTGDLTMEDVCYRQDFFFWGGWGGGGGGGGGA